VENVQISERGCASVVVVQQLRDRIAGLGKHTTKITKLDRPGAARMPALIIMERGAGRMFAPRTYSRHLPI